MNDGLLKQEPWQGVVVGRLPEEELALLRSLPPLRSVGSLFALYANTGRPVRVYDEQGDDTDAAPREGLSYYQQGLTVTFSELQQLIPEVAQVQRRVREWLGLTDTAKERVIAFASPQGAGAAAHADLGDNLSVQLLGEKLWRWTRTAVSSPDEVPATLPEDAPSRVLSHGEYILIRRGVPHQTSSLGNGSLALSFVFHARSGGSGAV